MRMERVLTIIPDRRNFKNWEWSVLVGSLILFVLAALCYFGDVPLARMFLGWGDSGNKPVAKLAQKQSDVRRQLVTESVFRSLPAPATLYGEDTIVTSSDGSAVIELNDGKGSVNVGPNTMVRLTMDGGTLSGLMLLNLFPLDVFKVGARGPVRPPDVRFADIVAPKPGEKLSLEPFTVVYEKLVKFQWITRPGDGYVIFELRKVGSPELLHSQAVETQGKRGTITLPIRKAGDYEWELKDAKSGQSFSPPTKARFRLDPEFIAITAMPPLVSGQARQNNRYDGSLVQSFDIRFRWSPYVGVNKYELMFVKSPESREAVFRKEVNGLELLFNKDKVYSGSVYFMIRSPLSNGFVAISRPEPFSFGFLPPKLSLPPHRAVISRSNPNVEKRGVYLTWEKTQFTEQYEFELLSGPGNSKVVRRVKVKDNFLVLKALPEGKYQWRVRSLSKSGSSGFGEPYEISFVK